MQAQHIQMQQQQQALAMQQRGAVQLQAPGQHALGRSITPRPPTGAVQVQDAAPAPTRRKAQFIESPFRGIYGYSHIPVRRIGFVAIPLTALILCHVPLVLNKFRNAGWSWRAQYATLSLMWINLFLFKLWLSIWLLGFSVRRATRLGKLPEKFYDIKAL